MTAVVSRPAPSPTAVSRTVEPPTVVSRTVESPTAPSPVPLRERTTPRDTSTNLWVRCPDHSKLVELFGIALPPITTNAPRHRRRPSPAGGN